MGIENLHRFRSCYGMLWLTSLSKDAKGYYLEDQFVATIQAP